MRGRRFSVTRLVATAALLGGAFLAYQVQWGAIGRGIDEGKAGHCAYSKLDGLLPRPEATTWFYGCRSVLTREEVEQACAQLRSYPTTTSYRLRLVCG